MTKYYDVVLTNKNRNVKISYLADSFSVNDYRILKIYSKEYGDVVVQIENDEELSVTEIELEDEWDDSISIHSEGLEEGIRCAMCTNPIHNDRGCDGGCRYDEDMYKKVLDVIDRHTIK